MLAPERRNRIELIIKQKGIIYVDELSEEFDVTKETIRKDLEKLETKGILSRTYGGAILNSTGIVENMSYTDRLNTNTAEKDIIGRIATKLISSHSTIFMDCSTTTLAVMRALVDVPLTVITNAIPVMHEAQSQHNVISTGGTFTKSAMSLSGAAAENMIKNHYTDFAVLGCKALSFEHGLTESNQPIIPIKQIMSKNAGKTIVCADSDKFDKTALTRLFDFSEVDYIVTNKKPNAEWLERMDGFDITVIYE